MSHCNQLSHFPSCNSNAFPKSNFAEYNPDPVLQSKGGTRTRGKEQGKGDKEQNNPMEGTY